MKKNRKLLLLGIVLIAVILIGVGTYLLISNKNDTKTNLATIVNKMKNLNNYQARLFVGKDTEDTNFPTQTEDKFSVEYTIDQTNKVAMYRLINITNPQKYTYFDYEAKMLYINHKEEYVSFQIGSYLELFELLDLLEQNDQVINGSDSFTLTIPSDNLKSFTNNISSAFGTMLITKKLQDIKSDITLTFKIDKDEHFTYLELTYLIENDEKVIIKADFSNFNQDMKIELPSIES